MSCFGGRDDCGIGIVKDAKMSGMCYGRNGRVVVIMRIKLAMMVLCKLNHLMHVGAEHQWHGTRLQAVSIELASTKYNQHPIMNV